MDSASVIVRPPRNVTLIGARTVVDYLSREKTYGSFDVKFQSPQRISSGH